VARNSPPPPAPIALSQILSTQLQQLASLPQVHATSIKVQGLNRQITLLEEKTHA